VRPCSAVSESPPPAPVRRHPARACPGTPGDPGSAAWPCGVAGRHPPRAAGLRRGHLGGPRPCSRSRNAGKALSLLGTRPGTPTLWKVTGVVLLESLNDSTRDLLSALSYFCLLKNPNISLISFTTLLFFCNV